MLKVASLAEVGQHTAEGVALTQKITATLAVSGATSSVYFGFSQGEWSIIGIICGIVIGALGLAGNLAVTIWFKHQHLKIARQKAGLDFSDGRHRLMYLQFLKGKKLYILAGVVTAAECYVTMGGKLPYSDDIPPQYRIGIAALLTAAGFVMRVVASRRGRG